MTGSVGVVIVGAGAAGLAATTQLPRSGIAGPLTLVNDQGEAPYNPTTMSKGLLQGTLKVGSVGLPAPTDDAARIMRSAAVSLDVGARTVPLADGREIDYEALLVANGARARALPFEVDESEPRRFATRLHGKEISVMGTLTKSEHLVHGHPSRDEFVVAFDEAVERPVGAVVVGASKTANKIRRLVDDGASFCDLATLRKQAAGR